MSFATQYKRTGVSRQASAVSIVELQFLLQLQLQLLLKNADA